MKIISKYKDYYDYLVGIYGEDSKLVLDRRGFSPIPYIPSINCITTFHIGEWKIQGFWNNNKIYFGKEIELFHNQNRLTLFSLEKEIIKSENYIIPDGKFSNLYCLKEPKYLGDKSPTWKEKCPILEGNRSGYYNHFPILREYNLQKFLPSNDIWLKLSEWLGKQITKNEPVVPVGDDLVRILSSGFDLKTSFRPKIKI